MKPELKKYIEFKLSQHIRINGFESLSKEALQKIVKANIQSWVKEAIAAGI